MSQVTTPKCTSTWLLTTRRTPGYCKAVQDGPVTGHRSDDVLPRKSNVERPGGESQRGVSGMDAFLRDSVLYSMLERS